MHTYLVFLVFFVTESRFPKLEAKVLSLTGEIIFSEIECTKLSSGCYHIQKTTTIAYVISVSSTITRSCL